MSLPQAKIPFGPDDYLAWEQDQPGRNEYVDGEVFAMSGASDAHGTAALNLAASLRTALRGTPCKPFIADMKVHVEAANSFFYPDIVVTCDPRDRSEVVLPVFNADESCWGVLDLDSFDVGAFNEADVHGLQQALEAAGLTTPREWRGSVEVV